MQYRNKEAWEPSDAALVVARISGYVGLVVGVGLIVVGLNQ